MRGLVTELAGEILDSTAIDCVYACGPNAMLDAVASLCRQRGTAAQLCFESYMRCGVGVCGSCEREGLLVCRDGPVFDLEPAGH